jgi:hypothetical protein
MPDQGGCNSDLKGFRGLIDLVDGLRDVSARVLLLPHQCECHGIRTLDADAAREDRTVGIPHRLDLS